jgi:hypothetical protein
MQHLEVSCAVRPIYGSLGAKGLRNIWKCVYCVIYGTECCEGLTFWYRNLAFKF